MKLILALITLVIMLALCSTKADAQSFYRFVIDSLPASIKNVARQLFDTPANTNDSIVYSLFTRRNQKNPCFIEPIPEKFDHCHFDPNLDTKILIHGFDDDMEDDKDIEMIKDALLQYNSYNVIFVLWYRYNGHPYPLAVENTVLVGKKVAEFIEFIQRYTGARYSSFHLIGHSLGAHLSGIAGKHICNLGRITGLDPAGPLYGTDNKEKQLYYTDAYFVDVIHSSNSRTGPGFGKFDAIGHIDYYPNGGHVQKEACNIEKENDASNDILTKLKSPYYVTVCNHRMSTTYFLNSIFDCYYLSTKCEDYKSLPTCSSEGNPTSRMGFFAEPLKGLPPQSKFFLKTSGNKPYC